MIRGLRCAYGICCWLVGSDDTWGNIEMGADVGVTRPEIDTQNLRYSSDKEGLDESFLVRRLL